MLFCCDSSESKPNSKKQVSSLLWTNIQMRASLLLLENFLFRIGLGLLAIVSKAYTIQTSLHLQRVLLSSLFTSLIVVCFDVVQFSVLWTLLEFKGCILSIVFRTSEAKNAVEHLYILHHYKISS